MRGKAKGEQALFTSSASAHDTPNFASNSLRFASLSGSSCGCVMAAVCAMAE
jgi:hypothetical protein